MTAAGPPAPLRGSTPERCTWPWMMPLPEGICVFAALPVPVLSRQPTSLPALALIRLELKAIGDGLGVVSGETAPD